MNSDKLRAYVQLLRPLNVLIAILSIAAAAILASGEPLDWSAIVLASMAGGLIAGGANAINDFYDIEIDRVNKRNRPLPRGAVRPREALILWMSVSVVGILVNFFLNWIALAIAASSVFILYLYSAIYKRSVLVGNFIVAFMTGLAFMYGGVAVGHTDRAVIPAVFAFLINLGRELVKDVEDIEGDAKERATTFAVKYGARPSLMIATTILIVLIGMTLYPYVADIYTVSYFVIVLIVDAALLYVIVSMWKDQTPNNLGRLSLLLKWSMLLGLVAIYVGAQ